MKKYSILILMFVLALCNQQLLSKEIDASSKKDTESQSKKNQTQSGPGNRDSELGTWKNKTAPRTPNSELRTPKPVISPEKIISPKEKYLEDSLLSWLEFSMKLTYLYHQNVGTKSTKSSSPTRIRLTLKTDLVEDIDFTLGFEFVDGTRELGSVGLLVPNNQIATDGFYREYDANKPFAVGDGFFKEQDRRKFAIIDEARFNWHPTDWLEFVIGVVNTQAYDKFSEGLSINYASPGPEGGFFSSHFIYPLAGTGLDKRNNPRVPFVAFRFDVDNWFITRVYLTLGDVVQHIFFDNTWGIEVEFRAEVFGSTAHYAFHNFYCDTEQSWTHHVSAGGSIQITQPLPLKGLFIFGLASVTEKHLVSEMFTSVRYHFAGGLTVAFDCEAPKTSKYYAGIGYSWADPLDYYGSTPEQVIEFFFRIQLHKKIQLTPECQFIINPNGSTIDGTDWLFSFGARLFINF